MYHYNIKKDIDSILDTLKHSTTSYPELEMNWKAIINYRLNFNKYSKSINDILKMWIQYLIPNGHKLVKIIFIISIKTEL